MRVQRLARVRLAMGLSRESAEPDAPPFDFEVYRGRMLDFAREQLRVRDASGQWVPFDPWDDGTDDCQAGILRSIDAGYKRIGARSGHKTGKSTDAAAISIGSVACLAGARVLITAPTDKQVEKAIWREVKLFHRSARNPIPGRIYETARTGFKRAFDGAEIFGFVAKSADAFSGPSGANLIILVDEAAGISPEIAEAIEGAAAGGAIVIMFGNPTQTSGPFFDAFHKERKLWKLHHLDSLKCIEFQERRGYFTPGLATREWYERCVAKWGEGDARTEVRCRGNFPSAGSTKVIPLGLYQAASARYRAPVGVDFTPIRIGLDVARFGSDKSIARPTQGNRMLPAMRWRHMDSRELALHVRKFAKETRRTYGSNKHPIVINVDAIGVGAGVYDRLCEFDDEGLEVVSVQTSERSDDPTEYTNLRAQIHFGVREWLAKGGTVDPNDEELRDDCLAYEFGFDRTNRIKVEAKDEISKRIGRSPDEGDALALSVYDGSQRDTARIKLPGVG